MVTYNDNGLKSGNKTAHTIVKKLEFCMTLAVTDQNYTNHKSCYYSHSYPDDVMVSVITFMIFGVCDLSRLTL